MAPEVRRPLLGEGGRSFAALVALHVQLERVRCEVGETGLVLGSFSPFTILMLQIDPYQFAASLFGTGPTAEDTSGPRSIMFIFTVIAVGAYTAAVWSMYRSMVKNFDMTIRRQSR